MENTIRRTLNNRIRLLREASKEVDSLKRLEQRDVLIEIHLHESYFTGRPSGTFSYYKLYHITDEGRPYCDPYTESLLGNDPARLLRDALRASRYVSKWLIENYDVFVGAHNNVKMNDCLLPEIYGETMQEMLGVFGNRCTVSKENGGDKIKIYLSLR